MTKMYKVTIDASGINQHEGKVWVEELGNIYADMEIADVSVSGSKISFNAGFSGMDDTKPDDIKMRLDEYLTMNEAFQTKSINVS
jgi:hypothetical protein